jgi:preprotein translocase subunit SecG
MSLPSRVAAGGPAGNPAATVHKTRLATSSPAHHLHRFTLVLSGLFYQACLASQLVSRATAFLISALLPA